MALKSGIMMTKAHCFVKNQCESDWPNQASGNGAIASWFHAEALGRAVPALRR